MGFVDYMFQRHDEYFEPTLVDFWETLVSSILDDGLKLSENAAVRVVAGNPGTYFGSGSGAKLEGRWTDVPADGVWCGVRAGYSENHWQPVLVKVDGDSRFVLDLHDWNEWKWALLARGLAVGKPEVCERTNVAVTFSYPLPDEVTRLMHLIADSRKGWTWNVPQELPELWAVS